MSLSLPARAALLDCANCGASLRLSPPAKFCPQCGQETELHAPTLGEFAHEFVGHFVAAEGTLWRTLRLLFTAPGRLTNEYFAGRRRRYVAPLRLYLSASFVFFLAVKIAVAMGLIHFEIGPVDSRGTPITKARDPVAYQQALTEIQRCIDLPQSCSWYERRTAPLGMKLTQLAGHEDSAGEHLVGMAPYAFILLLPVLAALVMLVYRSRHFTFGAHFVFALHSYSFALLLLAVAAPLPPGATPWSALVVLGYALWSMQVVYGGRWWSTGLRFVVVTVLFGAALAIVEVVLSLASLMLTNVN